MSRRRRRSRRRLAQRVEALDLLGRDHVLRPLRTVPPPAVVSSRGVRLPPCWPRARSLLRHRRLLPWRALRSRPHIVFRLTALPSDTGGAVYWPRGARAAIVIDPSLRRRERNAALAHELVHDERRGGASMVGMPPTWQAVVSRDEAAVDREVARRLVPPAELAKFLEAMDLLGIGVTAHEVAEHFDVTEAVATEALRSSIRQ
jgi:hypothetical protein